MSIFESLKNAIFGGHAQTQTAATAAPSASPAPTATAQTASAAAPQSSSTAPQGQVDIAAVLNQKAATRGEKLNWQSSIVDLMKLVDLDSSLENRKALAKELGYTGNTQDSASMNIWLHKEVMQKLAASGGIVPDSLRH